MPQIQYRKDYRPYPFAIAECRLSFDIFEERVVVESRLQFRQNPKYEGHDANCVLDGVGLRVLHLELDGQPLEVEESSNKKGQKDHEKSGYYRYDGQKLELLGTAGRKSFSFCAKVEIDPYNNKALEGFYRSGEILCTQNEPTGFRHITFYPDRPDVMSQFITEIRADKMRYPRLLSNGNLIKSEDLDGNRHYVCWEDPFAKPCYLYALVAGDLDLLEDHFTTRSGRNIDLRIYTDKGQTEKVRFAMQSLKQAMRWDEERFGREYDLDLFMIVAVDSFNFGAMENKGLNIFNSSLLFATEETATDATYENIAGVVAHEYFHNWTGNRITCRDWFQLTLKEGLTVYRDQLFSEDHFGHEVHRIEQVRGLRNSQYPEDAGPNRHPIRPESFIDINNFYTSTVYQKGAAVIRMMAIYLGEAGFRKGMDCYFERFDGQAVTCDDFVDALQTVGPDLTSLRRWYEQAGTPQLYVQSEWDGTSFTLKLRQENPNATKKTDDAQLAFPPLGFPLRYSLYSSAEKGKTPLKLCEHKTLIEERETIFTLRVDEPIHSAPVPSLMLDHCSPVQVHYDYSDEELLLLASADEDAFNRYEALQRYQKKLLLAQNGQTDFALNPNFVELVRGWLQCSRKTERRRTVSTLSLVFVAATELAGALRCPVAAEVWRIAQSARSLVHRIGPAARNRNARLLSRPRTAPLRAQWPGHRQARPAQHPAAIPRAPWLLPQRPRILEPRLRTIPKLRQHERFVRCVAVSCVLARRRPFRKGFRAVSVALEGRISADVSMVCVAGQRPPSPDRHKNS